MPNARDKVWYRHEDGERWPAEIVKVIDNETVDLALHQAGEGGTHIAGGVPGAKLATNPAEQKQVGRWWPFTKA